METVYPTSLSSSGHVIEVAFDVSRQNLATLAEDDTISVWQRPHREEEWTLSVQWKPEKQAQLSKLAWAHPAFGSFLVVASGVSGDISIWELKTSVWDISGSPLGSAQHIDTFDSGGPVVAVEFAPKDYGLHLAVATTKGLRLFSPSTADSAKWLLENELDSDHEESCSSIAWKPYGSDVPPMLLVGTSQSAKIWMHEASLMRWLVSVELPISGPVVSVAWSSSTGRPSELVAAALGPTITLFSLSGPADALKAHVEAKLQHTATVASIKWNPFGDWLAASTLSSEVLMWRANLVGQWQIVNRIAGTPSTEMQ